MACYLTGGISYHWSFSPNTAVLTSSPAQVSKNLTMKGKAPPPQPGSDFRRTYLLYREKKRVREGGREPNKTTAKGDLASFVT